MGEGFKVYILFLLWSGILLGVPQLLGLEKNVVISATIALCVALAATIFAQDKKEETVGKKMAGTYCHIWIFLTYCIVAMFRICFTDIDYSAMKDLGLGTIFYAVLVPIALIIEIVYKKRQINKGKD